MLYFFQNRISKLVLNFYRVYQRINKISEMDTRLIRASKVNSKKVYLAFNKIMSFEIQRMSSKASLIWQSRLLVRDSGSKGNKWTKERLCGGEQGHRAIWSSDAMKLNGPMTAQNWLKRRIIMVMFLCRINTEKKTKMCN